MIFLVSFHNIIIIIVINLYKRIYFCSDRDTISRVANALTVESSSLAMSISLLKLNSSNDAYERRENVKKALLSFPTKFVGILPLDAMKIEKQTS